MQIITDLILDVTRQMPVRQYLTVRQGDGGIRVLRITLTDMGEPLCVPEGTKAVMSTRKADGTSTAIDGIIDANGAVNFELSAQTLAAVGDALCDVQLISGMDVITSVPFELRVKPPVIGNEEVLSSSEYSVLAAVLLETQEALSASKEGLKTVQSVANELERALDKSEETTNRANAATEATKAVTAAAETALAEMQDKFSQIDNKQDKDTIVTEAANNTLLLEENQDARLAETSSLVLSMPENLGDWYRSTFSFQSGENATSLVYGYTPLDWKGDDVTSDGRFVPEPFSTYEVDVKNLGVNGVRARVDKIAGYTSVDVEGTALTLPSSAGKALRDYKIYGNSVQDGEPSEETPVAIQSVGGYNEKTRKYDVPIVVSGKNLLNPEVFVLGKKVGYSAAYDAVININDAENIMLAMEIPVKSNCKYSFTNENTGEYWVSRIVEVLPNGNGCRSHALYTSESKNYKCYSFTTREDTVALMFQVKSVDGSGLTQADIEALRVMLLEGTYTEATMPDYEPYRAPVTTTISLDEPLRKIDDVADYIDYTRDAVMRQVEVLDDTGTLPLEESYAAAESSSMERIYWSDGRRFLPTIDTNLYDNVITIGTTVQPSNVKVTYFKKGR